jgi:hypothetical protein
MTGRAECDYTDEAYSGQCESLHLRPWQWPPCWLAPSDLAWALEVSPNDHRRIRQAAELYCRMERYGIDPHRCPDPLAAIERAKMRVRT